jgi:hypothetical protein
MPYLLYYILSAATNTLRYSFVRLFPYPISYHIYPEKLREKEIKIGRLTYPTTFPRLLASV